MFKRLGGGDGGGGNNKLKKKTVWKSAWTFGFCNYERVIAISIQLVETRVATCPAVLRVVLPNKKLSNIPLRIPVGKVLPEIIQV